MDNMESWLGYKVYGNLTPVPPRWVDMAVKQKNNKVTLSLACSMPLTYSELDKVTIHKQAFN